MSKSPNYDRKRRAARYLGRDRLDGISLDHVRQQRRIEHEQHNKQLRIAELHRDLAFWQQYGANTHTAAIEAQIAALEAE